MAAAVVLAWLPVLRPRMANPQTQVERCPVVEEGCPVVVEGCPVAVGCRVVEAVVEECKCQQDAVEECKCQQAAAVGVAA